MSFFFQGLRSLGGLVHIPANKFYPRAYTWYSHICCTLLKDYRRTKIGKGGSVVEGLGWPKLQRDSFREHDIDVGKGYPVYSKLQRCKAKKII